MSSDRPLTMEEWGRMAAEERDRIALEIVCGPPITLDDVLDELEGERIA